MKNLFLILVHLLVANGILGQNIVSNPSSDSSALSGLHKIQAELDSLRGVGYSYDSTESTHSFLKNQLDFWVPRVNKGSSITRAMQTMASYSDALSARRVRTCSGGAWTLVGPSQEAFNATHSTGLGRVECIAGDPSNPNTLYIGTNRGGIYKHDGLTHTNTYLDGFKTASEMIGVGNMCVFPNNSSRIIVSTGAKCFQLTHFGLAVFGRSGQLLRGFGIPNK